jgi:DNA-binding NtrC family response regulator
MSELIRVLCVDDEPEILAGIRRNLRRRFTVFVANSGTEGLEALATIGELDVVVSDMRMPGMNGAQFLTQVAKRMPDVGRILLTGAANVNDVIQAVNAGGIERYLSKPCSPPMLAAAIEAAAERTRLRRSASA